MVLLSERYVCDRYLPDKAIDLIDEAGSRVRLRNTKQPDKIKELENKLASLEEEKNAAMTAATARLHACATSATTITCGDGGA